MKDKIFAVCEKLSKDGIKPTLDKVRSELGGGSFSTINPILKEWKNKQSTIEELPELPEEALKAVEQTTAFLWKLATEYQADAINAIKQECQQAKEKVITEKDEAIQEITALEIKAAEMTMEIKSLKSQAAIKTKEASKFELQIAKQQIALDTNSKSNEELRKEVAELRAKLETAQEKASKLEGMLEAFKSKK
jgi:chromosome segregation ATPase